MKTQTLGILIVSSILALTASMGPIAVHAQVTELAKNTLAKSTKIVQLTPDTTLTPDPSPTPDQSATNTPTPEPTPASAPATGTAPTFTNPDPIAPPTVPAPVVAPAPEPTPTSVITPAPENVAGAGMNIKTKPSAVKAAKTVPTPATATTTATSSTPFGGTLAGNSGSSENVYTSSYHFSSGMTRTLLELALVLGASGLVLAQKRSLRTVLTSVWD